MDGGSCTAGVFPQRAAAGTLVRYVDCWSVSLQADLYLVKPSVTWMFFLLLSTRHDEGRVPEGRQL